MGTKFTERLERAADGGMEARSARPSGVRRKRWRRSFGCRSPAALLRRRFENAVLLDTSPNPDLIPRPRWNELPAGMLSAAR